MATVRPLTPEQLSQVKVFLRKHYSEVIQDIFEAGLQVPLRISDLRNIKHSDIRNGVLYFKAKKTGKSQQLKLNPKFMSIVERRKTLYNDEYVFKSQSNRAKRSNAPIASESVWKALSDAGESLFGVNTGTHTMRKSWAKNVYEVTGKVEVVVNALQHSSIKQTLVYIGVGQESLDELTTGLEL